MFQDFNEWVVLRESNMWKEHKKLPSLFMRTHYALPTEEQLDEFKNYPNLTIEDIVHGFGYTIVGRGVNSPDNCRKIVESIKMLVKRYPDQKIYQEALVKAKEDARIKLEKWNRV